MAAILAKKLGMTQRFSEEDGRVERVTVLEAGPCPVTGIRTNERDGYDAVQLAFGETSRKLIRLRSELEEKRTVVANFKGGFLRRNPGPVILRQIGNNSSKRASIARSSMAAPRAIS